MSKSKKNVVDLDRFIADYGADTVRWFVLSDSPPERDVEYTESGVEGVWRFIQRLWAIFDGLPPDAPDPAHARSAASSAEGAALDLRKAAHRAVDEVTSAIEEFRFNSAVAKIHDFTNALRKSADADAPGMLAARAEACALMAQLLAPFMPHLAEEAWSRLGGRGFVHETPWPKPDADLLVDDAIVLPVQVNGKRRAEVSVPADAASDAVEAIAMADAAVKRSLEGLAVRKIIVVPGRIVNIVAN
jgi:leucyl-tRNA synthetase